MSAVKSLCWSCTEEFPIEPEVAAQARLRAQGRGARGRAAQVDDAMAAAIILEQYLSEAQA